MDFVDHLWIRNFEKYLICNVVEYPHKHIRQNTTEIQSSSDIAYKLETETQKATFP